MRIPLKKNSIYVRFILPLMAVILILSISVPLILLTVSGAQLQTNAETIFETQVNSRKDYLENEMLKSWSNIGIDANEYNELVKHRADERGVSVSEFLSDKDNALSILGEMGEQLLFLLRKNNVNDVFLILDTSFNVDRKYGIYLRDRNPLSINSDNLDVLIEIAPTTVRDSLYSLGLDKSVDYETLFDFSERNDGSLDFFYKPKEAHEKYPSLDVKNYGFWEDSYSVHRRNKAGNDTFTYTLPLIDGDGNFYGILGIGMLVSYIQEYMLPLSDFASRQGNYAFVKMNTPTSSQGRLIATNLTDCDVSELDAIPDHTLGKNFGTIENEYGKYYTYVTAFNLYGNYTPFADEVWALAGVINNKVLYDFSNNFTNLVILITAIGLLLCIGVFTLFTYKMTSPITKLTNKVEKRKNEAFATFTLDKTNIYEIDTLIYEIDELVDNILEVPQKLTKILEMTNLPIAAFEYIREREYFYYTDKLPQLLGFEKNNGITETRFHTYIDGIEDRLIESYSGSNNRFVYDLSDDKNLKFIEMISVSSLGSYSGIIRDVTDERLEKKKLEYERDMDALTPLMNRKGFERKLNEILGKTGGHSAIVAMDLDRLKYYNDHYGHETGDKVIITVGEALFSFCNTDCIGSHVSGDEFLLYIYGAESYEILREKISGICAALQRLTVTHDNGERSKITVSGGYCFSPRDGADMTLLHNYADFALYEAKKNRGTFVEFDLERYKSNAEKQKNAAILDDIITNKEVKFVFQPIVNLKTANVFAYEALMRPQHPNVKTPAKLLDMAKENDRLNDIEKLTFFGATETFTELNGHERSVKFFINTISSQILDESDVREYETMYRSLLPKIVLEFTEMEFMNDDVYTQRKQIINTWQAQCALDDYGMGFSNFSMLTQKSINYIKMDRLLIQDIHLHPHKREIVYSLVKYCQSEKIKIIAEGIEKKEELEVMLKFGVDYAQGYYLAYPTDALVGISDEAYKAIKKFNKNKRNS